MRGKKESIIDALIAASIDDPLGARRWGQNKEPNHPDGWGFVTFNNKNIMEYRSPLPIWKDDRGVSLLKENIGDLTLIHVRKTSIKGTEEYTENVQPMAVINTLWIGYNGTVEPDLLDAPEPIKKLMNKGRLADTAAIAWAALEVYSEDPLKMAMSLKGWLEDNVPEGSGAVVFFVDAQGNGGYAWECKCEGAEYEYYKIYIYEHEGVRAVASSTVALKHGGQWKEASEYGVI